MRSSAAAAPRRARTKVAKDLIKQIGKKTGEADAMSGLIDRNDVRSDVAAYITAATLVKATAGTVSLSALDNATIQANDSSEVTAKGGVTGVVVTNLVLSGAHAYVVSSTMTHLGTAHLPLTAINTSSL